MQLIDALASGIRGAELGQAYLYQRGTSTQATYYSDFEATQLHSALPLTLDANGSAVAYVNQLVDVQVRDSNGALVREFVAGSNATAVEVISQSFTGTDYVTGASGTFEPTTLAKVLDAWLTSAGSPDFNVSVNGVATKLLTAVSGIAGIFYSVKSYGATGDGGTDDSAAIAATFAAAAAGTNGAGTVFFPPGTYRCLSGLTVPAGVKILGSGQQSSKLAFESSVSIGLTIASTANPVTIEGMWIGSGGSFAAPGTLLRTDNACIVNVVDCVFGNDARTAGAHVEVNTVAAQMSFTRCYFKANAGVVTMVTGFTGAQLTFRDCDFINGQSTGIDMISLIDGAVFDGCRFQAGSVTSGTSRYISFAPATYGCLQVYGCRFYPNSTVSPVALYNRLVAPGNDVIEDMNIFGTVSDPTHITPYGYVTDGYADGASVSITLPIAHRSRAWRNITYSTNANVTIDAKAFGVVVIRRTGAGTPTIGATLGRMGDRLLLSVENASGGALTITFDAALFVLSAGATTYASANGTRATTEFMWVPNGSGSATGIWRQVSSTITI